MSDVRTLAKWLIGLAVLSAAFGARAAVLPEERADVLYHRYEGDNVTIDGPSFLVRKNFKDKVSVSANYYLDMVSSASIDVVTTASPYTEERTQKSLGIDLLNDRTIMTLNFANSSESDYEANTATFGVSQETFGGMTTISLGYSLGWDTVTRRGDENFSEEVDRQSYRLGITQVITKNLLLAFAYEGITDEGFLNNPYRSVRYLDPESGRGYSYEAELYPRTRTSSAAALRARYYLPYRAAILGEYRYFTDTWGIVAHTGEIGYIHPSKNGLTFEFRYRHYTQDAADFYSDLFPRQQYQNFLARDKELSTFTSQTFRAGMSWDFAPQGIGFTERGSVSLFYDFVRYSYDDFRDLRVEGVTPGEEPLFTFDADVLQFFVSFWF